MWPFKTNSESDHDVKYRLRDVDARMVTAWKEAFRDVDQVEVSEGDIFGIRADAIVSPANSFGYMDGGIDLIYSQHFGWDLQKRLQALRREQYDGELPVGQAVILETKNAEIPWLVSAPTMRVPMDVSKTAYAYLAFRAVIREVKAHNAKNQGSIRSVLCPGLGTATGKIPFGVCAKQMRLAYDVVALGRQEAHSEIDHVFVNHHRLVRDERLL